MKFTTVKSNLIQSPGDTNLETAYSNIIAAVENNKIQSQQLLADVLLNRSNLLQQAININENITDTAPYVQNQKMVNSIRLGRLSQSITPLSPEEHNFLISLASQCPEVAGTAVYGAIDLLPSCEQILYLDRSVACEAPSPRKQILSNENEALTSTVEITISPNPANNKIVINGLIPTEGYKVLFYSMQGVPIFERMVRGKDNFVELETAQLPSGAYIVKIVEDTLEVKRQILFIFH